MPTPVRVPRFVACLSLLLLGACAQEVGDIDRTDDNVTRKSDLVGSEWIVRQTIASVPATSSSYFVGYTLGTDRVRFDITPNALVAYRAYELNPGLSSTAGIGDDDAPIDLGVGEFNPLGDGRLTDQAILAFPIVSHFDVQRSYNAATGEQSNVITENSADVLWHEATHMRVAWDSIVAASWDFIDTPLTAQLTQSATDVEVDDRLLHREYDEDGNLAYFDVTHRFFVQAEIGDCLTLIYGLGVGDCAAQRIEVRTSFVRATPAGQGDYEPVTWDDRAMDRFGYFRTERVAYDRQRGATVDGRLLFANRHNLWSDTWQRSAAGEIVLDEDGKRVARPFAERTPKPVVYYLSPHFPEPLRPYAAATAAEWDRAFRRAVAAAQNGGDTSSMDSVRPMFVLCDNPVSDRPVFPDDARYATDCGAPGTDVRIGDVRYNVLWWVHDLQKSGPLGYGPSAADPLTGEILSGTAYLYGDSLNTYAQWAVDVIRFANGDLTPAELQSPEYIRDELAGRRRPEIDPRAGALTPTVDLARVALTADPASLIGGRGQEVVEGLRRDAVDGRLDTLPPGAGFEERRIRRIEESGLDQLGLNEEHLLAAGLDPSLAHEDDVLEAARITRSMRELSPARERRRMLPLHRECVLRPDNLDDSILGIAEAFRGRTDYDAMYDEIRGLIFKAVAEHEIGHTLGLRHNFAGSWDSLNYFDSYWDAKLEGFPTVETSGAATIKPFGSAENFADLYGMARLTEDQVTARMREVQYSSIMDYSSAFNTDFGGIGRYDEAAIMFAYTSGVDRTAAAQGEAFNVQEMGYVEVWDDLPETALELLRPYEGATGIGYYHPLEEYHYSTIVSSMGSTPAAMREALRNRSLRKLADVESSAASGDEERGVEVPYLFCSDEYRGTRQLCHTWDRGADPIEQTIDYIDRYRRFYFFDNYRRERLGWSTGSAANRAAERIFLPLVQGYQRWLLTVAISDSRPDPTLDNGWTLAAYAGLNLVAEAAATPSSGWYDLDVETGTYRLMTSRNDLSVFPQETQDLIRRQADFELPEGLGRPKWSTFDADLGYYYANFPERSGHYLTGVFALLMLTQSEAASVGVELGAFEQAYVIPPYLVFADELTALFNGIVLNDPLLAGPVVVPTSTGFTVRQRPLATLSVGGDQIDPETGAVLPDGLEISAGPLDEAVGLPVDLNASFSDQIYALLWGLSGFTSNYSARYVDQARIWELSAGESPTLAPGFTLETFCDPNPTGTGKCYAALSPTEDGAPGLGAAIIARGQRAVAAYEESLAAGGDGANALRDIESLLQDINIIAPVTEEYRRLF